MLRGFKDFVMKGNIVDLAIAVVIGIAFGLVVSAFAKDFIGGLIGAIGGTPDFSRAGFTINDSKVIYGSTVNALIQFVIVAAVIYFVIVRPLTRAGAFGRDEDAGPSEEAALLTEIRDLLRAGSGPR